MVNRNKNIKKIVISGALVVVLVTPVVAFSKDVYMGTKDFISHTLTGEVIREPGEYTEVVYFTYPKGKLESQINYKAGFKLVEAHLMRSGELDDQVQYDPNTQKVVKCTFENFTEVKLLDNGGMRYDEIPQRTYQYVLSFEDVDLNGNLNYKESFHDQPYPEENFPVPTPH